MKELFPIGSIVTLKEQKEPIMIIGYFTKLNDEVYDYMGVPYPTGLVSMSSALVFNHEVLNTLVSKGYEDEDSEKLLKAIPVLASGVVALNTSREG